MRNVLNSEILEKLEKLLNSKNIYIKKLEHQI